MQPLSPELSTSFSGTGCGEEDDDSLHKVQKVSPAATTTVGSRGRHKVRVTWSPPATSNRAVSGLRSAALAGVIWTPTLWPMVRVGGGGGGGGAGAAGSWWPCDSDRVVPMLTSPSPSTAMSAAVGDSSGRWPMPLVSMSIETSPPLVVAAVGAIPVVIAISPRSPLRVFLPPGGASAVK